MNFSFQLLLFHLVPSQWAWTQFYYLFVHFLGRIRELAGHCRREVEHTHPIRFQSNLFQQRFDAFCPSFGVGITFQVMAITG